LCYPVATNHSFLNLEITTYAACTPILSFLHGEIATSPAATRFFLSAFSDHNLQFTPSSEELTHA
jgi:hypothetical protein